jgi:hypothetical protein
MHSTISEIRVLVEEEVDAVSGAGLEGSTPLNAMRSICALWFQGFDGEWRRQEPKATD